MNRLHLIHGTNDVLKKRVLQKLSQSFSLLDREVFDLNETKSPSHNLLERFESLLSSDSLFSQGQFILLRHWDELKESERKQWEKLIIEFANSDSPHVCVIVAETIHPTFLSKVQAKATIQECPPLYGRQIIDYLKERFHEENLIVEESVYEYLLDISNQSLTDLDQMLDILIPAATKDKKITLSLCEALLSRAHNHSIFDLIRGIFTKNPTLSLHAFESLQLEGNSLQQMFFMIARTNRLLWTYKTTTPSNIQEWAKQQSISTFEAKRLQEYSQKTTLPEVSRWFERLAYLEELAKTAPEEIATQIFEAFLLES